MKNRRQFKRTLRSIQKWNIARVLQLVKKGFQKDMIDTDRVELEEQLRQAKIKCRDRVEELNLLEARDRLLKEKHGAIRD